jgi:hypothetical protein
MRYGRPSTEDAVREVRSVEAELPGGSKKKKDNIDCPQNILVNK